jgi:hypothetical protein
MQGIMKGKCQQICKEAILSAFAKFRKETISFLTSIRLSVCPSARPHETTPNGEIFKKFYIEVYFENMSRKFKFIKI